MVLEGMIVHMSKYVAVLMAAMYTYWNFRCFAVNEEKRRKLLKKQNQLMFLNHILSFAVMFLKTGDEKLLWFCGVQAVFL